MREGNLFDTALFGHQKSVRCYQHWNCLTRKQGQSVDKTTAQQLVEDIEAGFGDADLMKGYGLTPVVFYKYKAAVRDSEAREKATSQTPKLRINARRFLHDVKAYMDDQALMEKYGVTQRQLQSLFRQLIEAGLMSPLELANRLKVTQSQVTEAFVEMGKAIEELD
ncbi:MAG: hypothetical protein WBG50_26610 [Desulfomonilaceae bacterium]